MQKRILEKVLLPFLKKKKKNTTHNCRVVMHPCLAVMAEASNISSTQHSVMYCTPYRTNTMSPPLREDYLISFLQKLNYSG